MKRLRKATHIALVWVSVSLLLVDPAAACRLLAGRRCCCCPCQPQSCGTVAVPAVSEPSASDAPPVPIADADTEMPPAARPVFVQPAAPAPLATPPVVTAPAVRAPIVTAPELPEHSASHQPAAPAPITSNPNRQPVAVPTPVADSVDPLPAHAAGRTTAAPTPELPSPMPATLKPRQTFDSAIGNAPPAHQASPSSPMPSADDSPAPPMPPKRVIEPPMPAVVAPSAPANVKPAAPPAITRPEGPVVPPTFPPVDDDPFAPLPPAAATPRATAPATDDPFAPLPPPPARQPKAAPPIVDEPAIKLNDPLLPAADGRLPPRQWSDNSGQFRIEARLVSILDGKVRLLKGTGRTTTVPVERLSAADQQYVSQIIARYGHDLSALDLFAAR